MSQRTPLGKVRGLGSAKEGTDHFWKQCITGVANLILEYHFPESPSDRDVVTIPLSIRVSARRAGVGLPSPQ